HQQWRERQHLIVQNIELIRRLRGRYRMSVLSNADLSLAQRLRDAGIWDLFDDVIVSAEVGVAKPEPRIYALAAERLGLPPAECVFIDDAERNVDAARATGMHAVYFRVDGGHSEPRCSVDRRSPAATAASSATAARATASTAAEAAVTAGARRGDRRADGARKLRQVIGEDDRREVAVSAVPASRRPFRIDI